MAVDFNHTIVWVRDSEASATFLSEILGLPASFVMSASDGREINPRKLPKSGILEES